MRIRRTARILTVAGIAAIHAAVIACAASGGAAAPSLVDLTVLGAASLADVLDQVERSYEAAVPGTALTISTGASSALRTQIEQGAPADVFLSADIEDTEALVRAGLADGEAVAFAGNALTIIVPARDPAGIGTPADLARPGVKLVAAGEGVPITRYATQAVERLAGLPGYPPDFAGRYAANVVSREDNVGAVVAKIALAEGDAAIVYVTDAGTSTDVRSVAIPDEANVTATYAGVVIGASGHPGEARAFLDWLAGPPGRAVLTRSGFLPPP